MSTMTVSPFQNQFRDIDRRFDDLKSYVDDGFDGMERYIDNSLIHFGEKLEKKIDNKFHQAKTEIVASIDKKIDQRLNAFKTEIVAAITK